MKQKHKKIGLFGLSANPPHYGHLKMAQYAKATLDLDEVWWIVAAQNPLKSKSTMAPFQDRYKMCKVIADDYTWLHVSDIESRQGLNKSFNVLNTLKIENPDDQMIFIIGQDNINCFHKWYRWQDILKMIPIAVMARGDENNTQNIPDIVTAEIKKTTAENWHTQKTGLTFIDNPLIDISSTALRQKIKPNQTSPHVTAFIRKKGLYL